MVKGVGWLVLAGFLVLAGCNMRASDKTARSQSAVQDDLAARLDEVQASQVAALDLWDRLIAGETASCQDNIVVPDPVTLPASDRAAYPQAVSIQDHINTAITCLSESAGLWSLECADAREIVPLSTAAEGRATALAADDSLAEARRLLAEWVVSTG
jgi:hypothetical protein